MGEGAGKTRHRRASLYPPFPWHDPVENSARGSGVEGGVITSHAKPALAPTHSHPWDRLKTQKVCRLDGSGIGVRAGGKSHHNRPGGAMDEEFEDRPETLFFLKKRENAGLFFSSIVFCSRWVYAKKFGAIKGTKLCAFSCAS